MYKTTVSQHYKLQTGRYVSAPLKLLRNNKKQF